MTWFHALLLGTLEGLTEFLPVSSTGHLILLGNRLGYEDDAAKTLEVVIQLGAVIAVVVYYRARLVELCRGVLRRDPASVRVALTLAIAFVPAALVGLAFSKAIEQHLFGPIPVAEALIAGGVLMIAVEAIRARRKKPPADDGIAAVTPRRALAVGLAQCLSLWPGTSRSMSTIVGGQLTGLSTSTAADFSFLLAIPTLGAATAYKLLKGHKALFAMPGGGLALAVGMGVSFIVALAVIASFLRYLKRYGLMPFGIYRIALGAVVLIAASRGAIEAPHDANAAGSQARASEPGSAAVP